MTTLIIGSRVSYKNQYGTRISIVIELDEQTNSARIKWDDRKLRTWVRISALNLVTDEKK